MDTAHCSLAASLLKQQIVELSVYVMLLTKFCDVQALQTGKGPVQNWQEHVADPWNVNGFNYATKFFGQTIGN
jgi:hypothetical protein